MNQAVAFGLLMAGGVVLYDGLTGKGLRSVLAGTAGPVPNQGTVLTVAGGGQAIANATGSAISSVGAFIGKAGAVDPFAKAQGLNPGRVDMGQDFSMAPGSPILAPYSSKVLGITPNWYQGQPYVALQFTSGPYDGQNYYVAEQINPAVKPGQAVPAGGVIATYAPSGTGIEMGWAGTNWAQTRAQQTGATNSPSHSNTPSGQAFHQFLIDIGAIS